MTSETKPEGRGQTGLERVVLHVVQALTVAGIVGGYVSLTSLQTSFAVIENKMENLSIRLDDFKDLTSDRYTISQAEHDLRPILEKISDHEKRLRSLERMPQNNGFPQ